MPPRMCSLPADAFNFISSVTAWVDRHGGAVALVAVLVAWYVYRDNLRSQRKGVLDSLDRELEMHRTWVDNEYPGVAPRWWEENDTRLLTTTIFKLSIVAVDAAIANGPSLFLNRQLLPALVGYRQTVGQFNQLVDQAQALEANSELWHRFPSRRLIRRLRGLVRAAHDGGIGHSTGSGAYHYFQQATLALRRERRMRVRAAIWLALGLRFRTGSRGGYG